MAQPLGRTKSNLLQIWCSHLNKLKERRKEVYHSAYYVVVQKNLTHLTKNSLKRMSLRLISKTTNRRIKGNFPSKMWKINYLALHLVVNLLLNVICSASRTASRPHKLAKNMICPSMSTKLATFINRTEQLLVTYASLMQWTHPMATDTESRNQIKP